MLREWFQNERKEAGCDEAGRGCLAGAVFAAAVILPDGFYDSRLNDSKKMTLKNRLLVRDVIVDQAITWAVGRVEAAEIDEINILNASFLAMDRAISQLNPQPELLLVDGNRFRSNLGIDFCCIIGGDGKYASIAAASVLAKTTRDDEMERLSVQYPEYQWISNKGYPTEAHRKAIQKYGFTPYHRLTFAVK